jgi:hypothetical protein
MYVSYVRARRERWTPPKLIGVDERRITLVIGAQEIPRGGAARYQPFNLIAAVNVLWVKRLEIHV